MSIQEIQRLAWCIALAKKFFDTYNQERYQAILDRKQKLTKAELSDIQAYLANFTMRLV